MVCRACNIDKDLDLMVKHRTDRICKECNKKYRKSEYSYKTRPWSTKAEHKTCRKCNMEYHIDNFHKHKGGKYGVDSICKSCNIKQVNTLEGIQRAKQWQKDNRDIVNKRSIERDKKKWKQDVQYKIKKQLRIRMWEVIVKKAQATRSGRVEELIGCEVKQCKQHLEAQFKPEMNWDNHGVLWEIDHIKPCASFDLTDTEQQKQCFHYTNLQPLFKTTEMAESFGYKEIGNRNKHSKY